MVAERNVPRPDEPEWRYKRPCNKGPFLSGMRHMKSTASAVIRTLNNAWIEDQEGEAGEAFLCEAAGR